MGNQESRSSYAGKSFQFTEARLAAARKAATLTGADSQGRRAWRDEGCQGLSLVVNVKTGSAAFYFVGKVGGRSIRRALGAADVVRLEEAREVVKRLRYDRTVSALLNPRPSPAGEDSSPRVGQVLDELLQAHAAGRWLPGNRTRIPTDRTMKFYRDLREARFTDHEDLTLEQLAAKLPAIYAKIQAAAPIQANRFLQLVRNLYGYAAAAGLWSAINPATAAGTSRLARTPEKPRERVLDHQEWRRLDRAMAAEPLTVWRHLFTMSMLTLQRMGAVRNMRWSDLTLTGKAAAWKIPAEWMKGRKAGHVVPLAELPEALAILRERRREVARSCPWVFPTVDLARPIPCYKSAWKRILERAKLWSDDKDRRPRPHDLRRTGGGRMTEAGVPLQTVTRALGDAPSSAGMVARTYAQVADEALRDAFAATAKRRPRGR